MTVICLPERLFRTAKFFLQGCLAEFRYSGNLRRTPVMVIGMAVARAGVELSVEKMNSIIRWI